jgi:hypothetical protein
MTKRLPNLLFGLFALFAAQTITAQDYQPMPIASGLNADVIANGVGAANTSTTHTVDADDYVYMATNFQQTAASALPPVGLPTSGVINSIVTTTPGLTYQLGPLSGNNALRLDATTTTGTVTFTTPTPVNTLYMLGATGNGPASVTVLVNFSDGTSQSFANTVVPDWFFITTPAPAITGFGRLGRTSNVLDNQSGNPRLYQIPIAIPAASQSKNILNIQVTKTTTGGVVSIFAFSADVYTSCPSPTNITSVSSMTGATVNWTAPAIVPSGGYDYYVSTASTLPTPSTTPTGNVATNSVVVTGVPGQTYYIWVRSNCGGVKGPWKQGTFTAAQVTYTYSGADISTNYFDINANTLTTATATACPADFAVTVPPGYKILSVGTSYNMTSLNNGFQSEQRSLIACTTNSTTETAITAGPSLNVGTASYSRNNIGLATGLTGSVNFQMRAWRVWLGAAPDCSTTYNKVDGSTWKMIITYELAACTTPATPTAADQNVCPTATFADLSVNGVLGAVYKWYAAPTGGTAFASTATITAGTYYVSQTIGACESARSAGVAITLNPIPLPVAASQTFCGGATVAALVTTSGTNIKWYSALTGGTALTSTTALATGNYYASQTVSGCESTRATVAITVNTTPIPVAAAQTFCTGGGSTVANLQVTSVAGATVKWYATETATTPLATTAVLGTGTYYVSQTQGICESIRLAVQVTVATIVPPTVPSGPQQLCTGATVANLTATGSPVATYKWYATATSTTPLTPDTPVTEGTYYVSQMISACESAKASSQVVINNVAAPVVADQEFCAGATVASLQATPAAGTTIKWYATETSTTALTATTPLVSGTYYASQRLNTCESTRDAFAVIVHDVVNAPVTEPLLVCTGTTLGELTVDSVVEGATLKWYANNIVATPIAGTTTVVSGTTYFVSQTVGNCESARSSVTVTFNFISLPTSQNLSVCGGSTFADLIATGAEGATFNWYATLDGVVQLSADATVTAGTYYLSQTVTGCESGRVAIAVSVMNTTAPSPTLIQSFCGEAFVSDLVGGANVGYAVNWYSPEGDLLDQEDVLVTGTYTVSQTNSACESQEIAVAVVVTAAPGLAVGDDEQDFTAGQTVADLELEFIAGATIQWYFLNEDAWVAVPAGTVLVDEGVYGVTQTVGECESDIMAVTVNLVLDREDFALSNLKVYPNPSSDVITIEGNETLSSLVLMNLLGQRVIQQEVTATSTQINVSSLPQATYILQVNGANGGTATFKIVKQ